jgi:hypothetical protein
VERYLAVGQRCQPVRVSLDEHNMLSPFGEHDGGREPDVPCADYGRARFPILHALMLPSWTQANRLA